MYMKGSVSWIEFKQGLEESAKEELKRIFYIHGTIYASFNMLMILINFAYSPYAFWFVFPLLGWGSFLFLHYLAVFKWFDSRLEDLFIKTEHKAKVFRSKIKRDLKRGKKK